MIARDIVPRIDGSSVHSGIESIHLGSSTVKTNGTSVENRWSTFLCDNSMLPLIVYYLLGWYISCHLLQKHECETCQGVSTAILRYRKNIFEGAFAATMQAKASV